MRKLILLPLVSLALHSGKLVPPAPPPPFHEAPDLAEVYRALPARDEGRLGRTGDVLNMIFLGSPAQVTRALEAAGWTSLPITVAESTRQGLGQLLRGEALTKFPPMNDYRLMARTQDMNWVRVIVPIQTRHHFRLWRTGVHDRLGREVWWGSGNFDLSVRWIDFSHRPHPSMDLERDFVAKTLEGSRWVKSLRLMALPQIPRRGANDKGYPFTSDGRALVVELPPVAALLPL